ncbi:MAG TPA: DinB family protein [Herpetosiphonaceae bacterium]|nr:DinB family protein [Herpetosiphonaceae bacterium]
MTTQSGSFFDKETAAIWALIDSHSEDELRAPIRDDGWTAFQILSHMAISSRGILSLAKAQYRARKAGQEFGGAGPGFDIHRWNEEQVAAWSDHSLEQVRTEWTETGRQFHAFSSSLSAEDLELPVRFADGTPLTLGELLGVITFHLRTHRQELSRGLAGELVKPIEH